MLEGFKIVIDCVNGVVYKVVLMVLWELGVDVVLIGVFLDGFNINKDCGLMVFDLFCEIVCVEKVDIGIVFDGDVDRVIVVDEYGKIVDGD